MRRREALHAILGMVLLLLLLIGSFSAAFWLTSFLYSFMGQSPAPYLRGLIDFFVSLIIAIAITWLAAQFDRRTTGLFDTVLQAQKKIAQGDFQVSVDENPSELGPFGELVESVNTMALQLQKVEDMRQEFIANASHEIQSPLTSIRGFAQILRDHQLDPEKRLHYLSIIEAESTRLSKLSDNLLRLASLEAEAVPFTARNYFLDKQIRSAVLACEPQWEEKKISMELSLQSVSIKADEDLMKQVWLNLLDNSVKYTPAGGRVHIHLHQRDESILCTITDTGIGITEEDQQAIFERFFKVDKVRTALRPGSGLGLSIVKKIIDRHRGTIVVQSTPGQGSTFTVLLPSER